MSLKFTTERILSVHHWTDRLFSLTCSRSAGFRFVNGQFVMIGLEVESRPLVRAYSMASANYEDSLEFFSIKVADGPLTSRLQHVKVGDALLVGARPTGTLVVGNLRSGRTLWLLRPDGVTRAHSQGSGDLSASARRLTHPCRQVDELAYASLSAGSSARALGELTATPL